MSSGATKQERRLEAKTFRGRALRKQAWSRRMKTAGFVVGGAAAVVLVAVLTVGAGGSSAGVTFNGSPTEGGRIEALALPQLEGDGTLSYAEFADQPLVINFFASWCPNCIAEMPDFEQVHREMAGKVAFLGISQADSAEGSIQLAHETGITYPAGIDANGTFFAATKSIGMPTTLFIRPGGEVVQVYVGGMDAATLRTLIAENFGVSA
jgi:thiol-disulfide isomerase/thioredoxin